jgi:transcriptional regulator with XRE-family HTH domain
MAGDRSPTLRRRELGRRLRDLRAGHTIQEVADALGVSPPTISRIETGARTATRRNILALCELYGVDESRRAQLLSLAREASQPGWWQRFGDIAIDYLIGLEIEAVRISSYEPCVIPWMFQLEDYARSVIRRNSPEMTDAVLEERVEARLTRQALLTKEPSPNFWSVVDESVLRRVVGGTEVMRNQLVTVRFHQLSRPAGPARQRPGLLMCRVGSLMRESAHERPLLSPRSRPTLTDAAADHDEDPGHVKFISMWASETFDGQDRVMSRAAWDLQVRWCADLTSARTETERTVLVRWSY